MPEQGHLTFGQLGSRGQTEDSAEHRSSPARGRPGAMGCIRDAWRGQQIVLPINQVNHADLAVLDPVTFQVIRSWSLPTSYAAWVSTLCLKRSYAYPCKGEARIYSQKKIMSFSREYTACTCIGAKCRAQCEQPQGVTLAPHTWWA